VVARRDHLHGETYKSVVKMTFAKGASLEDPSGLFNSSLEGNTRRAIDFREGEKIDEKALKALFARRCPEYIKVIQAVWSPYAAEARAASEIDSSDQSAMCARRPRIAASPKSTRSAGGAASASSVEPEKRSMCRVPS
jgi:hypothetical protein